MMAGFFHWRNFLISIFISVAILMVIKELSLREMFLETSTISPDPPIREKVREISLGPGQTGQASTEQLPRVKPLPQVLSDSRPKTKIATKPKPVPEKMLPDKLSPLEQGLCVFLASYQEGNEAAIRSSLERLELLYFADEPPTREGITIFKDALKVFLVSSEFGGRKIACKKKSP
jgi:hypothetical protein